MSSNKRVKDAMIERYGAECFIEKLKLRDTSGLRYTGKAQYKRMKMLTYHHIKMKSRGGKATIENGAILSAENHQWFHQQPKCEQERMNDLFQGYKRNVDNGIYEECQVIITSDVPKSCEVKIATFNLKEFDRAREKRKTQKLIQEYYEGEER